MIVGMGTVFSFLVLMVLSMAGMERLLRPWADSEAEAGPGGSGGAPDEMERIAVAIAAAADATLVEKSGEHA